MFACEIYGSSADRMRIGRSDIRSAAEFVVELEELERELTGVMIGLGKQVVIMED